MSDLPTTALCAVHPARPAHQTCARCGRFCCGECVKMDGLCEECLNRPGAPSGLAVAAIVVGIIGLCTFLPGAAAIALAQWELARIANGESPAAGRGWAEAGRALGIVGLIIGVLLMFAVGI